MSWIHLEDTRPKARKPYRCMLCDEPIPTGTIHIARSGVFEGEMITSRMHSDCEEVTERWGEEQWENQDVYEFRLEKAEYFAALEAKKQLTPKTGFPMLTT